MLKRHYTPRHGQMVLLSALLIAAVFAMLSLYKCSHRVAPNPFKSEFVRGTGDTLNVAIEMNPAVYQIKGDTIVGRDYALLQQISQTHGVPLKLYPFVPLSRAIDGLERGEFDIVVASLPLTTELKSRFLMTDPVYLDREILVQRVDSGVTPIKSQVELAKDTVWLTDNSPFRARLENMAAEIGDTIYIESSPEYSAEALFILTAKGKIKYAVINEGIAKELQPQFDNVDISTPISFTQFQSWALAKSDSTLLDSINSWIKSVKSKMDAEG